MRLEAMQWKVGGSGSFGLGERPLLGRLAKEWRWGFDSQSTDL